MKIGAKIMLGFGLVIAMMLIIAIVVVTSNISSMHNVEMVSVNAELQTLTSNLQNEFLNSRVPANLLYNTRDPAVYAEFTEHADIATNSFAEVEAYISGHPELNQFSPPIKSAHESFTQWREVVDKLGKQNEYQVQYDAELAAVGGALSETTSYLLEDQLASLSNDINSNVGATELLRRTRRLELATTITREIATARVLSRQITGTYDPAPLPDAIAAFDRAIEAATIYRDEAVRDSQKEAGQKAIDAITSYRNSLESFGNTCVESADAKSKMPALNDATQSALLEAYHAVDDAMGDRVESTSRSSAQSLVIVIIVLIISILAAVIMALVIMRGITGPVKKMHNVIEIVGSTGRMSFSEDEMAEVRSGISKDEIGQSIEAFVKMMNHLVEVATSLERVADGDLTVDLKPVSEDDTMGLAVASMVDHLNNMFSEISASTDQVSTGSSQIADGAQMLAQGATEQSATVEELSASVTEIAEQTRNNAAVAEKTRVMEDNIRKDAEQGARQMEQMMQAVKDISDASQSIGKVIKIIDDIAFQTNILALNAAVEAARAGQHGKGFAVVADEVRNLAAKSAAAAKDTGELIETSIKKSEMGASISEETSKSLSQIVEGILQSSKLVADIAKSSGEQSIAVAQISEAIDQVSQVVQQNSATSEQSAAASEEMSGQAAMLKQLISRFKLKDARGMQASALSGPEGGDGTGFAIDR